MLLKLYYLSPAIIRNLGGINVTQIPGHKPGFVIHHTIRNPSTAKTLSEDINQLKGASL